MLINDIINGSNCYNTFKMRLASEPSNSTIKEDLKILDKPRAFNIPRANILAQMAVIAFLLKRALSFIVRITNYTLRLKQLRITFSMFCFLKPNY